MKHFVFYLSLLVIGTILISCQKESMDSAEYSYKAIQNYDLNTSMIEFDMDEYIQIVSANEDRLTRLELNLLKNSCTETAIVPNDYSTIQDAVDAVCEYGDVIVKNGTYNETVTVNKPGLHIKGNDNVTVNGSFILTEGADYVKIRNFTINLDLVSGSNVGIYAVNVTGGTVMQNTITGPGYCGIYYWGSCGISVRQNTVSNLDWGIFMGNFGVWSSNDNIISDNTVTGISDASCIGLQGDADNNLIIGNTVTNNTNSFNAGIMLLGGTTISCDGNEVINNKVTYTGNGTAGCRIMSGSYNTIGPNNIFNNNNLYGIRLGTSSSNNHVFKNTALNNTDCDIVNQGTSNSFKKNTADCTQGID